MSLCLDVMYSVHYVIAFITVESIVGADQVYSIMNQILRDTLTEYDYSSHLAEPVLVRLVYWDAIFFQCGL